MNAPCSGAPLTAPHVTTGGLCRWKAINKEGRHVGLDFYDLLIEDRNPVNRRSFDDAEADSLWERFAATTSTRLVRVTAGNRQIPGDRQSGWQHPTSLVPSRL